MATSIDTKQIAERVQSIRVWRSNDGSVHELCGYIEQLLDERKDLLEFVAVHHAPFLQIKKNTCDCNHCTEYRQLSTVGE